MDSHFMYIYYYLHLHASLDDYFSDDHHCCNISVSENENMLYTLAYTSSECNARLYCPFLHEAWHDA